MRKIQTLPALLVLLVVGGCATAVAPLETADDLTLGTVEFAVASAPPASVELSALAAASASPLASKCKDEFFAERPPIVVNRPPASELNELCFTHFAVLHSGSKRGPLWSAYLLTKKMSEDGDTFTNPRPDYHEETALPEEFRSREADYAANPYDVGHMTPNNDMPDESSQLDSFSMANMSPQLDKLNRGSWKSLEAAIHKLAQKSGRLYIVSGPIFSAHPTLMNRRVAIPDAFFKAVYDDSTGRAIAFVFKNRVGAKCELLSIAKLESRAKIRPFPTLSEDAREHSGEWEVPKACKSPN